MVLYCFSCTGNSRRTVEPIRRACGGSPLFVAAFPVHAQTLPRLVRTQWQALPPQSGPACLLCTYGGVNPGSALADAASLLTAKGLTVIAAAELPDRHSYDRAGVPGLTVPRRWTERGLERFLTHVVKKADTGGGPVKLPRRLAPGKYLPQRLLAELGTCYPAAGLSRCTRCGACQDVCPTGAAFGDRAGCIRCAACVDVCPVHARAMRFRTPITCWYLKRGISKPKEPAFYL